MKYVPLFINCRRLIMTVGVQKSNEWIENRLFCADNEASVFVQQRFIPSGDQGRIISRKADDAAVQW